MTETIAQIEARRLHALEKQAALYGPQTEPAILIEIQELKHRKTGTNRQRRGLVATLDYDFLMNVVAAALVRLGSVEANQTADRKLRYWRQLIHDVWMVVITIVTVITLIIVLRG